jgi:hypothetical protein
MASKPASAAPRMPALYNTVVPLSSTVHADFGVKPRESASFAANVHAVPLPIGEFMTAQRSFPIVFSVGEKTIPLALMGLTDGRNNFVDTNGQWKEGAYVPAYVRRHPFILVKANEKADEMTLCFDQTCPDIGKGVGQPMFEDGKPTAIVQNVIRFCEEFEQSAQLTATFVEELQKLDLLIDGEVTIQLSGQEKPAVYRGFRMVAEEKLKDLRGDQLRKLVQNGMLPLIYAHLMSLSLIRDLYALENAMPAPAPTIAGEASA